MKERKKHDDIQELIPEAYRDLVEAVPRGFMTSAVNGAALFGALAGALLAFIMPSWLAAAVPGSLLVAHLFYRYRSDKLFGRRMEDLEGRRLDWKTE